MEWGIYELSFVGGSVWLLESGMSLGVIGCWCGIFGLLDVACECKRRRLCWCAYSWAHPCLAKCDELGIGVSSRLEVYFFLAQVLSQRCGDVVLSMSFCEVNIKAKVPYKYWKVGWVTGVYQS